MAKSNADAAVLKEFDSDLLASVVDANTPLLELLLLVVQHTRFRGGKDCLGVAMSHSMVGGQSVDYFHSEWSRTTDKYVKKTIQFEKKNKSHKNLGSKLYCIKT